MSPTPKYRGSIEAELNRESYMNNFQNILDPGHEPIMTKEYKPKLAQYFDRYLTPEQLKTYVLNSPKIQLTLESLASNTKQSRKEIDRMAKDILNEIGLARNLAMIRWAGITITRVGKCILKGIYVNESNIIRVRDKLGSLPVLYLPSHRSYCDFILMSYICFKYDIEIPGIAAGMDFNAMIGMGTFLRKTGAFYMRRSFTGDDLYWEIFREYMHALVTVYHIGIEFFIEGTRSRNFKALVPKIGLLSMALEPFFMGQVPDVMIVPVSIAYDKVLEEQLFVHELLGVPKPKETTKGFFKALKIIGQKFGSMYVDFGEPISVANFWGSQVDRTRHSNIASYLQKLDRQELLLIKELAYEVVYRQQERIVIFTFNLVALCYSYNVLFGRQLSLEQLCNGVLLLRNIFTRFGANVVPEEKNVRMEVIESVELHSNILHFATSSSKLELVRPALLSSTIDTKRLKAHNLNPRTMQMGTSGLSLQLYINPCIFWLSGPALMILAATKLTNQMANNIQKDQLRLQIDELSALFSQEFVIVPGRQELDFYKNLEILAFFKIFAISDRIQFNRNDVSDIILSSIVPFLCCYYQVVETILEMYASVEFSEKELMIGVQQRIEALLTTRPKFIHPYCLSLDNINTTLASLVHNVFIEKRRTTSAVKYFCNNSEMMSLHKNLEQYLELLPFTINEHCSILSKL